MSHQNKNSQKIKIETQETLAKQAIMARIRRYTNYSTETKKQILKSLDNFAPLLAEKNNNKNEAEKSEKLKLEKMKSKLEKNSAQFIHCQNQEQISDIISNFLQRHNLPLSLKIGENKKLSNLINKEKIAIQTGTAKADDINTMSLADAAVTETATLVLTSSPQNPVSLNFLPENHIILIEKNKIVERYEDALKMIAKNSNQSETPRTINFITGPSRSADIEQTLLIGAHGPQKLLVICCETDL